MKTKEELNALKEEVEALNKKLAELTEEELAQLYGGFAHVSGGFNGYTEGCKTCVCYGHLRNCKDKRLHHQCPQGIM